MKKYGYVDVAKLFFALMVVLLHSNALEVDNIIVRVFQHSVCQIGVPFFFVSAGFFLEQKIRIGGGTYLKKYVKRLFIPFIFWLILNYPLKLYSYYKLGFLKTILLTIRDLVFYPWGAMWYVLALIVASIICCYFYKKDKLNQLFFIGLTLYSFALLCNNYYFLVSNTFFSKIVEGYLNIAVSARNGIFEGILFVSIGMLISTKKSKISKVKWNYMLFMNIFFYLILILEIISIKLYGYKDDGSLFITYVFIVPLLFCLLIKKDTPFDSSIIRNYSSGIYFTHRFILGCLSLLFLLLKISVPNYILFFITIAISFVMLKILYLFDNKYINMLIK